MFKYLGKGFPKTLCGMKYLGDTHNSLWGWGGGSTSGRYYLVFRNRDMYYQEILYESGRYRWGVVVSKNNVGRYLAVVEL